MQSNLTTDSNGKIIVKNLKGGNYQFVEVKAPQGYQINKTPVKFTINDSSSNAVSVKVTAENQPLKSSSSSTANNTNSTESSLKPNSYSSSSNKNNDVESSEVSVEVSSKKATLVSSNIVILVPGQGSSSRWTWSSKATLVSSTTNVPVTKSSIVIISKPAGSNNNGNNGAGSQDQEKTSGNGNLPTPAKSSSTKITSVSATGKSSSKRLSSSKNKNGKILPQTGEDEKMMSILTVVGMVIIVGVTGIKLVNVSIFK